MFYLIDSRPGSRNTDCSSEGRKWEAMSIYTFLREQRSGQNPFAVSSRLRLFYTWVSLAAVLGSAALTTQGQGRLETLLYADPLIGFSQWSTVLPLMDQGTEIVVEFDCGLAGVGQPSLEREADSLSAWMVDAQGRRATVLFQLSAGEDPIIAPRSIGFLPFDPHLISLSPVQERTPPLDFKPITELARHFSITLPALFQSPGTTLHLSLVENRDDEASAGWLSNLVVIPEPSAVFFLAALGLLGVLRRGRFWMSLPWRS